MFRVSRLRLQPVLVMEERALTFEGYLEKVGPAVRVQSRWDRSPSPGEIDRFLRAGWPTGVDGIPLGEDSSEAAAEGIPVKVTVRIPAWWERRAAAAQARIDALVEALQPPAYLSMDEQDRWIEARANKLDPEDLHRQLLRELEAPGPTREEREAP